MPCLKDQYYSDAQFSRKMKAYFAMFFQQPVAVLEAYQRTRLLKESIKVVATDTSFRFSGSVIGGATGIPLPFYISPTDPTNFPDMDGVAGDIGGLNLMAFIQYVMPRLMSDSFSGAGNGVTVYGLSNDYYTAKEQTASVQDSFMDQAILRALAMNGSKMGSDKIDSLLGSFVHDGLFPAFKLVDGKITPITAEVMEPSTIAGYNQTLNPEHGLAPIAGLLLVPDNWWFTLSEPPTDNFSDLLEGLNFGANTPGVTRLSSSLFTGNKIGQDGVVKLGYRQNDQGFVTPAVAGLEARGSRLKEAVRTNLLLTYAGRTCAGDGELKTAGRPTAPQGEADGFELKSTMYIGSDVRGTARPVLLLFKRDQPRVAKPISVCTIEEVTVNTSTAAPQVVDCGPGDSTYAAITFDQDVSATYAATNKVAWRSGPTGHTVLGTVSVVTEKTVIVASDTSAILPCCAGAKDDYGVQGELIKLTGVTNLSSEIFKASCDEETSILTLELFDAVVGKADAFDATITLADGTAILVELEAATTVPGVFVTLVTRDSDTCDLCNLDCSCLIGATFAYVS